MNHESEWIGKRVGSWRLEARLGAGGRAEVFRGRRVEGGYDEIVAIKILKEGVPIAEAENERKCLAQLQDSALFPRLVDGGVTAAGSRGYTVMEYIEGRPIDQFANEQGLDLLSRLSLFRSVCRAMEQMVQREVLHLDLKPSNVLVTELRPSNVQAPPMRAIKIVDFGQARMTAVESRLTAGEGDPVTLEYASPERVGAGNVTAASDVYSAGALLYHLLAGRTPLGLSSMAQDARVDAILNKTPLPASMAAWDASRDDPKVAKYRRGTPASLRARLQGGLDIVLGACLEKDPERRYPDAASLLTDINLVLLGRRPAKKPSSLGYRAVQFSRSKPAWIAAAGLIVTSFYGENVVYAISELFPGRSQQFLEALLPPLSEAVEEWRKLEPMVDSDPRFQSESREIDHVIDRVQELNKAQGGK